MSGNTKPSITNLFLTGPPSSGKTTIIRKVVPQLPLPTKGFYTVEEREEGRRVGFLMRTLDGKSGYLAHQDIESEFRIRRYGVSVANIESIAVPAISPEEGVIVVLDEIGKMECFSTEFIQAATAILDSDNIVVGTITLGGTDYIREVKKREDIQIYEVTPENRDGLPERIAEEIQGLIHSSGP